ncbi:MAG: hypothetical protein IKI09_02325 [Bacteroidales bacterium]|nr:hypothetical protein [Bacteroidales bacterium]
MKQNKMYEAPKVELITMEMQGILCSSVPATEEFGGNTGMMLQEVGGTW